MQGQEYPSFGCSDERTASLDKNGQLPDVLPFRRLKSMAITFTEKSFLIINTAVLAEEKAGLIIRFISAWNFQNRSGMLYFLKKNLFVHRESGSFSNNERRTGSDLTDGQQEYLRALKLHLKIVDVQANIDLSSIENIDNITTQKAIMQVIMEFLFFNDCYCRI